MSCIYESRSGSRRASRWPLNNADVVVALAAVSDTHFKLLVVQATIALCEAICIVKGTIRLALYPKSNYGMLE